MLTCNHQAIPSQTGTNELRQPTLSLGESGTGGIDDNHDLLIFSYSQTQLHLPSTRNHHSYPGNYLVLGYPH